ncbi:MAG: putative endonuclease 4 [Elusimicrobia bacterium ADurb.Bin231]|nr:MAG: putative endonuclease 4 [Elusimicrobia bacterium ADurb.Bin231]
MRLGFHCSVGKGLENTVKEALRLRCETVQIFSRSPRSWARREFDIEEVKKFRAAIAYHNISPLVVHMLYLPNLASCDENLRAKSIAVLIDELKRCKILGARYLVVHPGRYASGDFETGIAGIINGITLSLKKVKNEVMILLENLAGGKTDIGKNFQELRRIIDCVKDNSRIGVCLDTCHLYAGGYDISGEGFNAVINKFDSEIGLSNLRLFHLNDSAEVLGSGRDRHAHIGTGYIGLEGFASIVNHKIAKKIPGILETPRSEHVADLDMDIKNITKLRDLII